jgi:O-antigen ligase
LIFVAVTIAGLWHTRLSPRAKSIITAVALVLALGGFAARYAGYFAKGATSVAARTDYWQAAVKLTAERPWFGSGPGTFRVGYKRLKSPEAEMTRLVHNDYLQQACDSGLPGFLLYSTFVLGSLFWMYRKWRAAGTNHAFVVWFGLAALAAQSVVEFGLYIPALAWPFFALLGWLWGAEPDGLPTGREEPSRTR